GIARQCAAADGYRARRHRQDTSRAGSGAGVRAGISGWGLVVRLHPLHERRRVGARTGRCLRYQRSAWRGRSPRKAGRGAAKAPRSAAARQLRTGGCTARPSRCVLAIPVCRVARAGDQSAVFALHRRNDLFPASPGSTRVGCMGHCRRSRASGRSASRAAIADTVAVAGFGIHADADECRRRRRAVPPPGWLAARAGTGRGAPAPVEPRAIAAAPAGRTAHHQTLGALIDWSFALLSEREQALLCALGVFAGGWTLDGAMTIGAAFEFDGEQTLDLLGGLVDKSLVAVDASSNPPRYSLLDSVRLFALARLGKSDDEVRVRRAHLAHYIDFTARVDAEIRGGRQPLWNERVLREQANLLAAFGYALVETDLAEGALTLCANLCWYFRVQGEYYRASQWLDAALQATHAQSSHRARALIANGIVHHHRGVHQRAIVLLQEGISLAVQLGDDVLAASGQGVLAFELAGCGDFDGSEQCVESALSVASEHASDWLRSVALLSRGVACAMRGQHHDAEAWMSEAAELMSLPGADIFQQGYVLINRALQRYLSDDVRGAAQDWLRMLDMSVRLQHQRAIAGCIEGTAYLVLKRGDAHCAATLLGAAAFVRELTDAPLFPH